MKIFLLMFMLCITANVVFAQKTPCKVLNPSPFYKNSSRFIYVGELQSDDIITVEATSSFSYTDFNPNPKRELFIYFTKDQDRYCTFPQNLAPVTANVLFDKDVLTDNSTFLYINENTVFDDELLWKEMWVPMHYVDVLRSRNREILPKYEPELLTRWKDQDIVMGDSYSQWYAFGYAIINNGMIKIFNPIIYNYGARFLIENIEKHENEYTIKCFTPKDIYDELLHPSKSKPYFNWSLCKGDTLTMILYVDGEYIDIYMNEINPSNKFGTIVRVKEEFIRQFMNLVFTGNCDLSKVHFPIRADGSMDYPPPVLATDTNATEETENTDDSATAEFAKEKPTNKGSGFKIILIAGIAVLLGGGAAVFVMKKRK
jgi:hypothetical protein